MGRLIFGVATGQRVEQCVVRVADCSPDVFAGGRSYGHLGVEQVAARVDEILPVDVVRWRAAGRSHLFK